VRGRYVQAARANCSPGQVNWRKFNSMSRSSNEELIEAISELNLLFPELRMGQLVANLVTATGGMDAGAIWDIEDGQLLVAARRLIERNRGRQGASTIASPMSSRSRANAASAVQ
jgi:hypothetical protein